jgi:hypothetical protein
MLTDPWLSDVSFVPSSVPNAATVYLREICDPVAAYSYQLDGVELSDFTYPEFWSRQLPATGPVTMDRMGVASAPLEPAAHSYILFRQITPYGGIDSIDSWKYVWGSFCMFGPC